MSLPLEIINEFSNNMDDISMPIVKILETHNFIAINTSNLKCNFWLKYKCLVCNEVINYIVGHDCDFNNTLENTYTCDEMVIKNILE